MDLKKYLPERRINTFIAILSLIVAIVVAIAQFSPRSRELTCNVISSSELTAISQVSGLSSEFTFNQKKVTHLWKIDLTLLNSGTETLIGEGQHSLLIKGKINFGFPENVEILNLEITNNNLPITVEQPQFNTFALLFSQWKPNERANLSIYVTSQDSYSAPLIPQSLSRDIVDGNILITTQPNAAFQPNLIDRLPFWVQLITKVLVSILCALFFALGLFVGPAGFITTVRSQGWLAKNRTSFATFLDEEISKDSEKRDFIHSKEFYLTHPERLPKSKWKDFDGSKYPGMPIFDSYKEGVLVVFILLLFGIAGGLYIASTLYEFYLRITQ